VNPFTDFVDHQMKMFVLLSTGGTLTSLTEATGIGSGASETQMDTWKQIVRADVRIVSNAINQQLCKGIIERNFKGKPMLAEFRIDTEPQMTAKEVAELASAFSGAGYEMDEAELSQLSGFTTRKKQEGGGMGFNAETTTSLVNPGITTRAGKAVVEAGKPETSGPTGGPLPLNAGNGPTVAPTGATEPPRTPQEASLVLTGAKIPKEEPTPQEAATPQKRELPPEPSLAAAERADAVTPQAEAIGERLVRSLQDEFKDVADEIAKVLALPEDKRAGAAAELLAKIDGMVSDDPAMAEVIEEQMREAFRQQLEKQPEGDAPAANKAIPN
jgi:hypothetical protein